MKNKSEKTHIVLRIKPTVRVRWDSVNVVSEHSKVFAQEGIVAVGKFGAPLPFLKCIELAENLKRGAETWLYLVFKKENLFQGFRGRVKDVFRTDDNRYAVLKCPDYYTQLPVKPSMWFVLSSQLESYPVQRLNLRSSDRPLIDVLAECRTPMMFVNEKPQLLSKTHKRRIRARVP